MLILYCQNNVVIGYSDDSATAVPAEQYGTNVRVIPWPYALGDLQKVGTEPPPDPTLNRVLDHRPYAQPTETPAILLHYAAQVRWDTSTQGITFTAVSGTIPASTDRLSQTLVDSLATYAQTLPTSAPISFTQNNVLYTITAQEAMNLSKQMSQLIQNARQIEGNCITDLKSATPTILTYADVDARFAGVRMRKTIVRPPQPKPPGA